MSGIRISGLNDGERADFLKIKGGHAKLLRFTKIFIAAGGETAAVADLLYELVQEEDEEELREALDEAREATEKAERLRLTVQKRRVGYLAGAQASAGAGERPDE